MRAHFSSFEYKKYNLNHYCSVYVETETFEPIFLPLIFFTPFYPILCSGGILNDFSLTFHWDFLQFKGCNASVIDLSFLKISNLLLRVKRWKLTWKFPEYTKTCSAFMAVSTIWEVVFYMIARPYLGDLSMRELWLWVKY